YGINSIVVNAADIPTTVKEKIQKTDARDSRKIAKSLQNNDLTAIYIPSKICLNDRSLNRYRGTVSKDLSRIKNRIKSLLNLNGHLEDYERLTQKKANINKQVEF